MAKPSPPPTPYTKRNMLVSFFDMGAFIYMLAAWVAYAQYAKHMAKHSKKPSLSKTLRKHRVAWIRRMLVRELRVGDAALLANQERVVGFFASTTVLLLAAVITAFTSTDTIRELSTHLPFAQTQDNSTIEIKFFLMAMVLVYAFFTVTWSLREYGFVSVLMGSMPNWDEENISQEEREDVIQNIARLMDAAGHDNNSGLRAYYFSLAMLFWLFNTWFYIAVTTLVILVLYQREFRSKAIRNMTDAYSEPRV